jgi:hypothetical protein
MTRRIRGRREKSSKHQLPSSREIPSIKLQSFAENFICRLELEVSLEVGAWNLELGLLALLNQK